MRPKSIIIFDWLYLGLQALTLAISPFTIPQAEEMLRGNPATAQFGAAFGSIVHVIMIASLVIGVIISLVLWYFVSRRRSNVAKWIIVAFTAYGALSAINVYVNQPPELHPPLLTTLPLYLVYFAAIYCLFRKDAVAWLEGKTPVDPNEFK